MPCSTACGTSRTPTQSAFPFIGALPGLKVGVSDFLTQSQCGCLLLPHSRPTSAFPQLVANYAHSPSRRPPSLPEGKPDLSRRSKHRADLRNPMPMRRHPGGMADRADARAEVGVPDCLRPTCVSSPLCGKCVAIAFHEGHAQGTPDHEWPTAGIICPATINNSLSDN